MEVYVFMDGFGGCSVYRGLSDFVRSDDFVKIGVSERTLRGWFADPKNVRYECRVLPLRSLVYCGVVSMMRKRVRPKYLFGKEY